MSLINWEEKYSVKVASIDNQHKKLIELINELYDGMMAGKSKEILGPILDSLVAYTSSHFKTEEIYFDKIDYSETEEHKLEHQKFVNEIIDFKSKFNLGELTVTMEVAKFLKSWLLTHILGTDQKYTKEFLENGIQ